MCDNPTVNILLKQREQLVSSLERINSGIYTFAFSAIAGIGAIGATVVNSLISSTVLDIEVIGKIIFILTEFVFLCTFFLAGLIHTGNTDRAMIAAIDEYLLSRFEIKGLIYQGKSSYSLLWSENKSRKTIIAFALSILVFFLIVMLTIFHKAIFKFIIYNTSISIIIVIEIVLVIYMMYKVLLVRDEIRKKCLAHLKSQEKRADRGTVCVKRKSGKCG